MRFGHCPSKYGLLTAKAHLLGATAPKTPNDWKRVSMRLNLRHNYSTNKINTVGKNVLVGCSPLGENNPAPVPRQGRMIATQSCASRPVCGLAGP